jgi:hypothetical protein
MDALPGHRANLLNPEVDRVGVAVVASRGVLYAVADYERAVPVLTQAQVEAHRRPGASGKESPSSPTQRQRVHIARNRGAREAAASQAFSMLWQDADLNRLPKALVGRMPRDSIARPPWAVARPERRLAENSFTAYRVAVLLY